MSPMHGTAIAGLAAGTIAFSVCAHAQEARWYQLDPFARATSGDVSCSPVAPPMLDEQEMRAQAHSRVERGASCCLAGTCECGGAYKRDPEINDRVVKAIANDARFPDTSIWVTTTRAFVTLQGCVRNASQKRALERLVKTVAGVALVWNETTVPRRRAR